VNLLDIAETLHRRYREVDGGSEFAERALREALRQEFNLPAMVKARLDRLEEQGKLKPKVRPARDQRLRASLGRWFDQAVAALEYVTKSTAKHYFAKAREYEAAGIIRREPPSRRDSHPSRLQVVDLPSLRERSTKLLAINALVETEWENVRVAWESALEEDPADDERVPTFIVVDEAHNLIPKEVRGKSEQALREQFRTIIAEGRKYGLFLVLVSQRPDKLDPLVISECENRALMRMNSRTLLGTCRELLSLEDVATPLLDKCLEFGPGRVLLVGPWAQEGQQFLYCAARRTVEGGRNLREDFWAAPP